MTYACAAAPDRARWTAFAEEPPVRRDLRGLEPPQQLVRALEASEELGDGVEIVFVTTRRPVHLLPLLVERGFQVDDVPLEDGHEVHVRRRFYG